MKKTKSGIIRDEDLPESKRNELIGDYQKIVDEEKSGDLANAIGVVKFAEGRLKELRRASASNMSSPPTRTLCIQRQYTKSRGGLCIG